ncbi:MAG: DUF3592 domain-containing protein [Oscillospiraceae bacterium]
MYAMRTRKPVESAIAFTILGVVGLLVVLFFLLGNIRLVCFGETVEGIVVSSYEVKDDNNESHYLNTADYVVDGKKYRLDSFSRTKYPMLDQTVTIHYDPKDPSEACTSIWGQGVILPCLLLASVLLLAAAAFFFWEDRKGKN